VGFLGSSLGVLQVLESRYEDFCCFVSGLGFYRQI
jgi:hypothetical protein